MYDLLRLDQSSAVNISIVTIYVDNYAVIYGEVFIRMVSVKPVYLKDLSCRVGMYEGKNMFLVSENFPVSVGQANKL